MANEQAPLSLADQVGAGRLGGFTGADIRGALEMARGDVNAIEHDLTALGKESRHEVLRGEDRARFFEGMSQKEFDLLHKIAMHLGDGGMNKLEQLMNEASEVFKSKNGQQEVVNG